MDTQDPTTTLPPPLAVDTKEAARLLSVSEKTLRDWRSRGGGPTFVRLHEGKCAPIRYLLEDLREWLTERRMTSTAAYPAPKPRALSRASQDRRQLALPGVADDTPESEKSPAKCKKF